MNFSISVNGSLVGFLRSSRGLSQGDPLSPFLFIIVFEVLSKMLRRAEQSFMSGFLVGNDECRISHLQFVDDTMIFCDADVCQLGYLRCILSCFEAVSSLHINLAKSELFPVGEVSNIENLAWILGCKIGTLPSSYLGLPLRTPFKSKSVWDPVLEQISRRLDS